MAFKLSAATRKSLGDGAAALRAEIDDLRDEYDEKSEKWKEGDKGVNVEAWLETLTNLVDEIEDIDTEPEA